MPLLKKLTFAIPFLICFYWFTFSLTPYFRNIYLIFGFDVNILINLIILSLILVLGIIFFTIFVTLAVDWKIILPVILVASLAPVVVFSDSVRMVLAVGFLAALGLIFFTLNNKLAKYITFDAGGLINPSIKNLAFLIILVSSFGFYLTANLEIKTKGFQVPDALLEATLKMVNPVDVKGIKIAQAPTITQEQIDFLRKNPQLLEQYGLDPGILDSFDPSSPKTSSPGRQTTRQQLESPSQSNDFLKTLVKSQFEKMIEPYLPIVSAVLALIFFFTLSATTSLVSILNPLILKLIFYILEKTNFVKFEKEMREVKKLVV